MSSAVVLNYFNHMEYSINAIAEYEGNTSKEFKKKVRAQFYLVALGKELGSSGLYQMGIDGEIGPKTHEMLIQTVGTSDLDQAIPLLKDLLAPQLEARNIEWNSIVNSSGSLLNKP